jgi:hypothetical protein
MNRTNPFTGSTGGCKHGRVNGRMSGKEAK